MCIFFIVYSWILIQSEDFFFLTYEFILFRFIDVIDVFVIISIMWSAFSVLLLNLLSYISLNDLCFFFVLHACMSFGRHVLFLVLLVVTFIMILSRILHCVLLFLLFIKYLLIPYHTTCVYKLRKSIHMYYLSLYLPFIWQLLLVISFYFAMINSSYIHVYHVTPVVHQPWFYS